MIPTPARHPEAPPIPDSVAWQPIPIYRNPPPQTPPPAPSPAPKLVIGYFLFLALGTGAVGLAMWNAGVAAGQSGSAAKIQQLETTAAATDARIDAFCEAR